MQSWEKRMMVYLLLIPLTFVGLDWREGKVEDQLMNDRRDYLTGKALAHFVTVNSVLEMASSDLQIAVWSLKSHRRRRVMPRAQKKVVSVTQTVAPTK